MKVSSVIAGASAALVAFQAALYASHGEADLLRPPGAHGEKDFASRCVKCGKCMEACPYIAIKPARDDAGAAVGTPMIDARAQACRLCEDFPCVEACPTNALRDIETRSDVKMGVAVIDEDLCIAFQGMRCEVCYRTCPLIDEAIVIDYRLREGDAIHSVFAPSSTRTSAWDAAYAWNVAWSASPRGHPHRKRRGAGGRHRALGMTSSAQLRRAPLNKLPNRWRFRT